jgi:hypothetical protein
MATKYSARTNWQLRMQRKVGADYIKGQTTRGRTAMIVAAVAAIHAVLLVGFLNWRGYGHPLDLLVHVKLIPVGQAAPMQAVWHPVKVSLRHEAAGGPARN